MDLSLRIDAPEIMDSQLLPEPELRGTLRFLERTNRWFGGDRLVFHYLERWSRRWPRHRPLDVLDVGTGGADLPVRIARWASRRGLDARVTGIDSNPEIARLARQNVRAFPEIEIVESDLQSFAQGGRRFDVVIGSLFLHHVSPAGIVEAMRLCDRLATRAVLFSDLRRCRAGYWATRVYTALFGNRVVRFDGPLSIRRAFTSGELSRLAQQARLPYLRPRRHAFFRLALAGEKGS